MTEALTAEEAPTDGADTISAPLPDAALLLPTVEDEIEFSRLSRRAQERVRVWAVHMRGLQEAGHGTRDAVMRSVARREGCSFQTVRGKYYRWLKEGWRALVNRSVHRQPVVPAATVQYMTTLVESHQRQTVGRQSWRALKTQLTAWLADGGHPHSQYAIPGYHTPPRLNRVSGLPPGWDYGNMLRLTKRWREDAARKQGPKAFSATIPSVLTSRAGCEVGQILFFDDEIPDIHVAFMGNNTLMRPLAFHCLDFVSGCNIGRGFKPVIQDGNSRRTVASQLTKQDFDWFLISILTQHGWNDRTGTTLIGEMGTAALSDGLAARIHETFGGKVQWDHSGRFGEPLRGMIYEGQSCGNFRFKAPLESWFNLLRNWSSALPGQAGRNREMAPESTYGLLKASARYFKILDTLPEERRALYDPPGGVFGFHQFCQVMHELIEHINRRQDHTLNQWEKMGFFRLAMLDRMDPGDAAKLLANPEALRVMAGVNPLLRPLSPREVFSQHSPRLKKLTPFQIVTLMPPEAAREVTISPKREIVICDREIDSDPLHFTAGHCVTPQGDHLVLRPGDTVIAYLNPYAPWEIHLCRPGPGGHGGFLGTCPRRQADSRADKEAIHHQCGRIRGAVQPSLDDVASRATSESNRLADHRARNRRVEDLSKPLTESEHAAEAARQQLTAVFSGSDSMDGAAGHEPEADPFASFQ